jgi:HK97 family phage major capsid protein
MKSIELRQKRAKLIADMGEYTAKASKDGRSLNAEEKESFDKMLADEKELRSTIEAIDVQEGLARTLDANAEHRARETRNGEVTHDSAFERLIRVGPSELTAEERSALRPVREQRDGNTTVAASMGYTVPQGFGKQLIEVMKLVAGPLQVATVINTDTGADLPYAVLDDTANSSTLTAENAAVGTTDFADAQMLLKAYKYPAQVKLSIELLQDNGVNIQAKLADILGRRIARTQNVDCTTGSGSSKPKGFLAAGTAWTSSSASAFTYADLVGLKYSVNGAYRENGTWQMSDTAFATLLQLHDDQNRPLIMPAFGAVSEQLFGQKVVLNNSIPSAASTSSVHGTPIAYGDFSQYYIRVVNGVFFRVLNELYAGNDMVGFRATQRMDGQLAVPSAIAVMTQPLSA